MDQSQQHKLIVKILIGAAWADRHLEAAELAFLRQLLERYGMSRDRELRTLLESPIPLEVTERWVVDYLRDSSESERLQLLAKIGKVLIADDEVSDVEHDLLDDYHDLMAQIPAINPPEPQDVQEIAHSIGHDVTQVVQKIGAFIGKLIHRSKSKS
ncbi:tellurite resistance TerB family protein [Lyngbya confervoides]|uniref:TerB family tellurite resistance protein n=1 Tax=Lyngbya confervoides BDU141951 TaxID=1574623 RepID=A0ABD4T0A8_9CYAN|nr:TerB family tellurite resistance protein [Lyngbya confervoides]MCM1982161.1 TerB family tellurite resistance protein [Lyngbya confervoides BDU141951]